MTKAPIGTLKNIDTSEIKTLLKENKGISGFKEYFREQVQSSLENKGEFKKEDFEEIKEEIEKNAKFLKILYKYNKNPSYALAVEWARGFESAEEFESFGINQKIINFLMFVDDYKLRLFINLCNSKDYFLTRLKDEDIRYVLLESKSKNFSCVINLYKKIYDFGNFCGKQKNREILYYANEKKLEKIVSLSESSQDFEYLLDKENIRYVFEKSKEHNFEYFINICKSSFEFEYFCNKVNIRDVLENTKEQNLKNVVELYNIKTAQDFEYFCNDINIRGVLEYVEEENLEFIINNFDENISKKIMENTEHVLINNLNIEKIQNHKLGKEFGFFVEAIKLGIYLREINFPINKDNFLDFMQDDDLLIEFEKDEGMKWDGTIPWTKKWFLEKPERKEYLTPEKLKTFEKFGTIIGLGLIEGSQDSESINKFYEYIFQNISLEKNRSSILQLGEVFNLILKEGNYEIFDEILVDSNIATEFREFIEENKISNKGRTILTLMITREIRDSFAIFKNSEGKEEIDFSSIETLLKGVQNKLKLYKTEIDKYKNLPIKTSIGMEYEVTQSIAKGYFETIGSNYKNDIEIISEYAEVAKGNDAVHEIATSPTDNPMLLILEMKLLEDLDFLDLNFKKEDYERASRGLHITIGGEYGIILDANSNFIQNILIASNIGGLNAGEEVKQVNNFSNIRAKNGDCEAVFGRNKTPTLEYRSLGIDKKEQFERLILSIFNLNMAKQDLDKNIDKATIGKKFEKLQRDIEEIIENHNKNFVKNEILDTEKQENISRLFSLMTSTGPVIQIMQKVGVDIYYFKSLKEEEFSREEFEIKLKSDGKDLFILTERQKEILFGEYDLRIRKELSKIKENDREIYDNIGDYLNGHTEDTQRKITNVKRWKEVIGEDNDYLKNLKIFKFDFDKEITPKLINTFTKINNLFIKKDSTNALATLDNTMEADGTQISDRRLAETTVFDKLEMGLSLRNGYNIIQGASENMLVQAIQKKILEFNENIFK
ncbi:MAG: hypothetical protein PHG82_02645 [Candidatus Gracilibacteria bacterium]|nr:hypothetical protein [Candidatus Gracilibacteria bacterium]